MISLIILDNPKKFPLELPQAVVDGAGGPQGGVEVVSAQDYVTHSRYSAMRRAKVANLCRSYKYQTLGHYVSLPRRARAPPAAVDQDDPGSADAADHPHRLAGRGQTAAGGVQGHRRTTST